MPEKIFWSKFARMFLFLMVFLFAAETYSQVTNTRITGATKEKIDTLSLKHTEKIIEESAGLMEREVDPNEYIMGPNDKMLISIVSAKSIELETVVSPEGKLVIPEAGVVNLKGKSLHEADSLITDKVKKVYKAREVNTVLEKMREFKVIVSGAVRKNSIVPATAMDRVSEVIDKAGGLQYDASLRYIQLQRNLGDKDTILYVDLLRFFKLGEKSSNPFVLGGDVIIVPPSSEVNTIEVFGEVPEPDIFEYVDGDSLSTLIKFGHGFLKSSLLDSVEIVRHTRASAGIERWYIDIRSWIDKLYTESNLPGDFPLETGDRVYIRRNPYWKENFYVSIEGQVRYPGQYAIKESGARVRDVMVRAGGPTNLASLEGALLIRKQEEKVEDKQMERLSRTPYSEMSEGEKRYYQARVSEQKGVMAINFKKLWEDPNSDDNILLVAKDSINIPQKKYFINVQGRVNNPGLVVYKDGFNYLDYINSAGGYGYRADESETIIHKSKGEQFLAEDMNYTLEPGDNILVPPKSESSLGEALLKTLEVLMQLASIVAIVISIYQLSKQ